MEGQLPSFGNRGLPEKGDIKAEVCQRMDRALQRASRPRGEHGPQPKGGTVCRSAAASTSGAEEGGVEKGWARQSAGCARGPGLCYGFRAPKEGHRSLLRPP